MKGKEFNELINFSKEQRLKELALGEGC
jgi:hypothetical protein